jgi:hypothetical protein
MYFEVRFQLSPRSDERKTPPASRWASTMA